jgi:hypothetical protein
VARDVEVGLAGGDGGEPPEHRSHVLVITEHIDGQPFVLRRPAELGRDPVGHLSQGELVAGEFDRITVDRTRVDREARGGGADVANGDHLERNVTRDRQARHQLPTPAVCELWRQVLHEERRTNFAGTTSRQLERFSTPHSARCPIRRTLR